MSKSLIVLPCQRTFEGGKGGRGTHDILSSGAYSAYIQFMGVLPGGSLYRFSPGKYWMRVSSSSLLANFVDSSWLLTNTLSLRVSINRSFSFCCEAYVRSIFTQSFKSSFIVIILTRSDKKNKKKNVVIFKISKSVNL